MKPQLLFAAALALTLPCAPIAQASVTASVQTQADNRYSVTLIIHDEKGFPLPGANVLIKGTNKGVTADVDGIAKIDKIPHGAVLVVSFTGMKSQSIVITSDTKRTIALSDDTALLDEVVATGYRTVTKRRTTGSVAVVSADELRKTPNISVDLMLQGSVAGVDVKAVSGRPGETGKIKIRGTNSLTGSTEPLWVVDGIPLQRDIPLPGSATNQQIKAGDFSSIFTNGIASIPPADIESVTILKDASAAAIYGSQASGGVIVVTTKRGKEGKMRINYSANVTLTSAPPRDANLMNAQEKLSFEQRLWDEFSAQRKADGKNYPVIGIVGAINAGVGEFAGWTDEQKRAEITRLGSRTTDWFGELFRVSASTAHHLSLSGGSASTKYYTSLGYNKNNGLVKGTSADQTSFSLKLDFTPNSKLSLSLSSDLSYQTSKGYSGSTDPFTYAYFANPYESPYNEDGSYRDDRTFHTLKTNAGETDPFLSPVGFNIFRELNETSSEAKNFTGTVRGNVRYTITDHLNVEGLASVGYVSNSSDNINGANTDAAFRDRPFENFKNTKRLYGSISQASSFNTNYLLRAQINYFNDFNSNHYVSALFGSEIRSQYGKSLYAKRYGYDPVSGNSVTPTLPQEDSYDVSDIKNLASVIDALSGQNISETTFASFYGSIDYSYLGRYVVSLTARTDGSNNFGSKEQFNPTGSIGLAWNADRENFFEKLRPVLSHASVRLATGLTGNVNRSVHPNLVMRFDGTLRYSGDKSYRTGRVNTPPNPLLRWEKTRDFKAGIDLDFWDDRINLGFEYYDRLTSDAISSVAVVSSTGYSNQSYNTSTLLNRGCEVTLSATPIRTDDWRLFVSANLAYNLNKLIKYETRNPNYQSDYVIGYPLGSIFTGKVEGIDPILGLYTYTPRPDAVLETKSQRQNGNNYLFFAGPQTAPINGGYSVSLSYKNLTAGAGGSFSYGGLIVNEVVPPISYSDLDGVAGQKEPIPHYVNDLYTYHLNTQKSSAEFWTPENPITTGNPRIIDRYADPLFLDRYMTISSMITKASRLEPLSYFKLGNIYLSYLFDQRWVKAIGAESISLTLSASNIFILSSYSGIDPETPGAVYPIPRTYTMGLSFTF